ncbi:MAG: thiamine-phosphate kinase [Saezia sp.]
MNELELIARYFKREPDPSTRSNVRLGIGDDCALFSPSENMCMAISTDMLVEGRHFLPTISPRRLGYKALAVNLSDLAAMGASPKAFTLSLSIPEASDNWCKDFAQGLFELADQYHCALIGGDLVRGPLCISITIFGEVSPIKALRRVGANINDDVYISHPLEDGIGAPRLMYEALCGRAELTGNAFEIGMQRTELPSPRVELGLALQGIATSAIDVSDGLIGDLSHILSQSHVGARIEVDSIPRSVALHHQPIELQRLCTLAGGDDYELLFTAPPSQRANIRAAARQCQLAVTPIGCIEERTGIYLYDARGQRITNTYHSFDHFKKT